MSWFCPILAQDANQRDTGGNHEWLFTKYDAFGRVAYTGMALDNGSRAGIQGPADAVAGDPAQKLWVETGSFANGGIDIGYGNTAYPTSTISEVLTVNYYDNYDFDRAGEPTPPPGNGLRHGHGRPRPGTAHWGQGAGAW